MSNPEVRMRSYTVKATNVRKDDVVIRVGKKVRAVKVKPNGEVRIKLYRQRKDVVLDDDRLVRIKRPVPVPPPTPKKVRKQRMSRYYDGRRERAARELAEIVDKYYPKRKMVAA